MLKRLLSMSWVQIRRVPKKIKKNLVSPISSFHLRHPSQLAMISPIYVHFGYLSHSHFTTIQNYARHSTDLNSAHSQLSRAVLTYFRAWVLAENKHRGKPDHRLSPRKKTMRQVDQDHPTDVVPWGAAAWEKRCENDFHQKLSGIDELRLPILP